MHFRTELIVPESPDKITLQTPVLTLGSCFAEVIGTKLVENKIPTLSNPFGTLFNPLSIVKLLHHALEGTPPDERLYVEHQGIWFHYDFHSSLWAASREELRERLVTTLAAVQQWLSRTEVLIITLGTAFVYRHLESGQWVANCHKTPSSAFQRELLQTEQIVAAFEGLFAKLPASLKVIFTVSPVRHTRDTLPLNAVSKSLLRVTCHELSERGYAYFPAFELLLDDLRDYRFYKSDLIHPNEQAEDYIFEQFSNAYFTKELQKFIQEWQKIRQAIGHRPLYPNTASHRQFLENLLQKLQKIASFVDVNSEIATVSEQLSVF